MGFIACDIVETSETCFSGNSQTHTHTYIHTYMHTHTRRHPPPKNKMCVFSWLSKNPSAMTFIKTACVHTDVYLPAVAVLCVTFPVLLYLHTHTPIHGCPFSHD